MCGRFTLRTPTPVLIEHFALARTMPLTPRFNIAPTQHVAVVRQPAGTEQRELVMLRWGLIPSWAKDAAIGQRMINARGETVAEKPAFRRALRSQRCLVIADGFYEWQKQGRVKQPYFVHLKNNGPLAFAGLWESWQPDSHSHERLETCTIITTQANELMREIHDRMPVILDPDEYSLWLDPQIVDPVRLTPLVDPYPSEPLVADPVSTYVNSPRHDDSKCIELHPD
jgi:putative SOS response-associated peptidase YedK